MNLSFKRVKNRLLFAKKEEASGWADLKVAILFVKFNYTQKRFEMSHCYVDWEKQ